MFLNEVFRRQLNEGGNLAIGQDQADQINLQVTNRSYIVPILNNVLLAINSGFSKQYKTPLWSPAALQKQTFLSGSSLHFFNVKGISDADFVAKKPKVGDIDTMVAKEAEPNLEQFLTANKGKQFGGATLIGFQRGNEQFSSLWALQDPPIKVQIDLEFVAQQAGEPTDWARFSHSSSWEDIKEGVKGVFHKFLIQSFGVLSQKEFLLRKPVGRGKARTEQDIPTTDNLVSFAVSSKEGGGLRAKYEPVLDANGNPLVIDNLPVMRALPAEGYKQDIGEIFATLFGDRTSPETLKQMDKQLWSFTGLLGVMNSILTPEEKQAVANVFLDKLFAKGAQGLYKNDPDRDLAEKNTAVNLMFKTLQLTPPSDLAQRQQEYKTNYRVTSESTNREASYSGNIGIMELTKFYKMASDEEKALFKKLVANGDKKEAWRLVQDIVGVKLQGAEFAESFVSEAEVKAQLRKGMPHLHDLKAPDFLDLLDEIHDGNGNFKLENIPLNVKVDGFGGRFGKNADGQPFMGTSRTEPRYQASFVKYHQEKGTTDPEILGRAKMFDDLFNEMMNAIKLVDSKLGPDFLVDKQVTCEVLFLPFATQTDDGRLKFVGIHYDKLPEGVQLALVPFHVVEASTGEPVENDKEFIDQLLAVGQQGSVMFINNRLTQKEGLDVTEIINVLDNIEELKQIVSDTQGKRDRASLQLKKEVEEKLQPIKDQLEQAIINDPNIIGKDMLGKDYEGIVINSRLGPIKITSQEQRDVISAKLDAKKNARTERPRDNQNKTAVVAIGSFVGHKGHQELWDLTQQEAQALGGDPYLFIGNAEGKDDPIPVADKVKTWHQLYPQFANNISAVTHEGGSIMQKIKHELINPLPGKPPRYDNIIIMVGEDRKDLPMGKALMKAVNKFAGYEHVKVDLKVTPRGQGVSGTALRNILKTGNPNEQYTFWNDTFNGGTFGAKKLSPEWIKHLMDVTKKGMGITTPSVTTPIKKQEPAMAKPQPPVQQPAPVEPQQSLAESLQREIMIKRAEIAWQRELLENQNASQMAAPSGPAWDKTGGHHRLSETDEELKRLQYEVWDFYKDVHGYRPRHWSQEQWDDEKFLVKQIEQLHAIVDQMSPEEKAEHGWMEEDSTKYKIAETKRMSAAVKLQRAWERQQAKSAASRERGNNILNPKKASETPKPVGAGSGEVKVSEFAPPGGDDGGEEDILLKYARMWYNGDLATQQKVEKVLDRMGWEIGELESEEGGCFVVRSGDENGNSYIGFSPEDLSEGLAEGSSGAKYKVKSIGKDKKGEYYVSPSTGQKVYKKAKVGDHEVPGSKEIKPNVEGMLPKSAFTGSDKNKLGRAGQLMGRDKRPARQGDLVGAAEGWTKTPSGDYIKQHTGVRSSKPPVKKKRGEKTGAEWDAIAKAKKDKEQGVDEEKQRLDPKCWKGYRKAGTKMKGGVRVNNCVPVGEDIENLMAGFIKLLENKK